MGRFGFKLLGLLLLFSFCLVAVGLVAVDDAVQYSTATLRGHSKELETELRKVPPVYRDLIATKKRLYDEVSLRVAASPVLTYTAWGRDPAAVKRVLEQLLRQHSDVVRLAVRDSNERLLAEAGRPGPTAERYRSVRPIGSSRLTLVASFPVSAELMKNYQALGRLIQVETPHLSRINRELQKHYVSVTVRVFGVVMLVFTVIGLLFARRIAKRVGMLSQATRRVAAGDLQVAVPTRSKDEIGQLAEAFNEMVTELRQNRAQIAYLQKISAWQQVARRLAHEIKNPLTPILLAIQQVHDKYEGGDEEFRQLLGAATDIVDEEVEGLRRLVEAFSAFAKLPQVQTEPAAVSAVMDDLQRSLGSLEGQGALDITHPTPDFDIQVDKLLFRRVLLNLVGNAFQAAADEGAEPSVQVRVKALPHSGMALLTVTDNGPGVPDDLRDRIFDPYFTTKNVGTGLGLAIVKKLVLEHRGSIDVEAPAEGGARFTLRVPMVTGD